MQASIRSRGKRILLFFHRSVHLYVCITNEFSLLSLFHSGHVSYLIGATPLHRLPCNLAASTDALRLCKRPSVFISRPRFHLVPFFFFSFTSLFFLSPFVFHDRSSQISQLDQKTQGLAILLIPREIFATKFCKICGSLNLLTF